MLPDSEKMLPDQTIGYNSQSPLNKAENIEGFIQPALGKPDPVLISSYVPDTLPKFSLFIPPLGISLLRVYLAAEPSSLAREGFRADTYITYTPLGSKVNLSNRRQLILVLTK